MRQKETKGEAIGHVIGDIIGFLWCLAILCGTYGLAVWLAPYFLGDGKHQDAVGLLAALAIIWVTERQAANRRAELTNDTFERLFARLTQL